LRCWRETVRWKRPEIWRKHNWLLLHDNAPTHTSLKPTEFETNNNVVIIPHPPYSPDLAPCDFALFPKLKMKLKWRCFDTVSDIQRKSQAVFDSMKENDFHSAFEEWKKMMGSLYIFPRRLFWRRWQPKLSKLSQHFFYDLDWELSDRTSYIAHTSVSLLYKKYVP
jgi:hypothetical protein